MHKGESKLRENRVNQSILEYTRKHLSRDRRNQKKLVKKLDVTIRTNWGNDRAPRILYSPRNEISNLARKRVINQCQMKQPPDLDHSLSNCSRRKTKELHTLRTARRNTCETNKPLEPRTTRYRGHLVVSLLSKTPRSPHVHGSPVRDFSHHSLHLSSSRSPSSSRSASHLPTVQLIKPLANDSLTAS